MIRLLLVDDHALFRSGIRSVLDDAPDIDVVAEASSGEEALEHVRDMPPDLVLMDINMPGMGGIEATRKIATTWPEVGVIAVTALSDDPFPNQLLDAGARGFLSKGCDAEELFTAIRTVARGRHYLSKEIADKLALGTVAGQDERSPLSRLSPREMQVMLMIVRGENNRAICDTLFLSPKTVSTYRHRLYEKLDVSNDVELTHYAIRHKLIDPSS